jgi:hypothetical protein
MALRPRKTLAQSRGHRLETAPAVEPVSLADVQAIIISPPSEDDAFITTCIEQARAIFESTTGIACITQSWKLTLDMWPTQRDLWWDGVREMAVSELHGSGHGPSVLKLPHYPLQEVDSIRTYGLDDTANNIDTDVVFYTDTNSFPGRLGLRQGQSWPIALREHNAVEIIYTAGFGDAASEVPAVLKRAVGNAAAFLYHNRGVGCSSGNVMAGSGAINIAAEYVGIRI